MFAPYTIIQVLFAGLLLLVPVAGVLAVFFAMHVIGGAMRGRPVKGERRDDIAQREPRSLPRRARRRSPMTSA